VDNVHTEEKKREISETKKKTIWLKLVAFHVGHPYFNLAWITLGTLFFIFQLFGLKITTDFFQLYPPNHPYIQLYKQYRIMFGTANVLSMAVEVKKGDIYNAETLKKIDRLTRDILAIKGVNSYQVISITHPKLKNITVGSMGVDVRPLTWPRFPETTDELMRFKEKIYSNEGIRGIYVSPNDKATLIQAGFWEEGVDLNNLYKEMMKLKEREEDSNHRIYITGYPMLYAWITHYKPELYMIFFVTLVVMTALLWWYFRSFMGIFIPLISAIISAIWGLGFAATLKINIDPLILVIPLLLSARALSHSVQSMERYHEEFARVGEKKEAIVFAYGYLYKPGILGTICDGLGVLTIAVATIPLMRNLAMYGSFWVLSIYVSSIVLHPVLVSLLPPPRAKHIDRAKLATLDLDAAVEEVRKITVRPGDKIYLKIGHFLIALTQGNRKWVVSSLALVLLFGGAYISRTYLKVGDTSAGKAILYNNHPYNISGDYINKNFLGANQMIVIAEGKKPGAMANAGSLKLIEDFALYSYSIPAVGGAVTITDIMKRLFRTYHDGNPKWSVLPETKVDLAQMFFILGSNMAPGELDRFVSVPDYTNATVTIYFKDYNNRIIHDAIDSAKNYIQEHPLDEMRFRLAGGIIGILASVNEEVEWSYWMNMLLIFSLTFMFCWWAYRTWLGAIVLFIPLLLSQVLCDLLMLALGIDMNINSLPICSVGVGIGVDYGIYVLARLAEEYQFSNGDYDRARYLAITSTGKAVIFTASTLVLSIFFFIFSTFKFQADMAILLCFLLVANMVGALAVLPALVSVVGPERLLAKYRV
jgi:hypothetical protein